eukprot:scaffold72374_cov37-Tisochrysis_lutea.AAC.1
MHARTHTYTQHTHIRARSKASTCTHTHVATRAGRPARMSAWARGRWVACAGSCAAGHPPYGSACDDRCGALHAAVPAAAAPAA